MVIIVVGEKCKKIKKFITFKVKILCIFDVTIRVLAQAVRCFN